MPHALDRKLERLVSRTLKTGIAGSGALMVAGFALALLYPETMAADQWQLAWLASQPLSLLATHPSFYLTAGILLLMCTPILRVLITLITFVIERDWRYVLISAAVLLILSVSIVLAALQ
jgi:uncharacterized membrane protein